MPSLIALNKPFHVVSQFSEHEAYETLKSYIDCPDFYPAGRLDQDSEGLLLLTNNGKLQSLLSEPKYKLTKTYWAQVEGDLSEMALLQLRKGVKLKEFTTQKAQATKIEAPAFLWERIPPIRERKTIPTSWLEVTISEGKNRQVRKMCAAVGFPCLRLIRVAIGDLNLFDLKLKVGEWQFVDLDRLSLDANFKNQTMQHLKANHKQKVSNKQAISTNNKNRIKEKRTQKYDRK